MEGALREEGLAGVVWALVEGDGPARVGAAGASHVPSGRAMTRETRVHVGSVAKTVLALGVLRLVSEGRLALDAPVEALLPGLRFDNPWPDSPVRVRHLLDHTAGLEDGRLWQLFTSRATPDTPLREAVTRDPGVLRLRTRPGEVFSYSNLGFTLAALVVEVVTGERYEAHLDRALLAPLGMHESTFGFTTQAGPDADPRLAWGHEDALTVHAAVPLFVRPASQFTTTAGDLARLARFLLGDGRVEGRPFVREELLRAMGRVEETQAARAGLRAGYALGLQRRDRHGAVGLCHGGSIVGFHAMLCLYPEAGKAFAVVHDTDKEGADYGRFEALLVRALALPAAPSRPAAGATSLAGAPAGDAEAWLGRYVPAPTRFPAFEYVEALTGSVHLGRGDGGALALTPLGGDARALRPAGGPLLVAEGRLEPSHVLLAGEGGERLLSNGQHSFRRVPAAGFWLGAGSLGAGLLGLLWFLVGVPLRGVVHGVLRRRGAGGPRGRNWRVPGTLAAGLLLAPAPLLLTQDMMRLGEPTPGAVLLWLATLLLPVGMAWQAWRSARDAEGAGSRADLVAALGVLQWCGVLLAHGALPFALWR
jgi:CubicO group peptidase (beta-lactamase class C family)